jgi:hypothetical protein
MGIKHQAASGCCHMTYSWLPIGETEFLMKVPFGLNVEGLPPTDSRGNDKWPLQVKCYPTLNLEQVLIHS